MISYEQAVEIVDSHAKAMPSEKVGILEGRNRFVAGDVFARYDSPPFDNAAVDGYGRGNEDLGATTLTLVGEVAAGMNVETPLRRGGCVRIFTGAMIPPGVGAVSMQEDCERNGTQITFHEEARMRENIRPAGSDVRNGDRVLRAGNWLGPAEIALAASAGVQEMHVHRVPSIGILTTGSELLDLSQQLIPAKIYNSNFYGFSAAADFISNVSVIDWANDEPETLTRTLPNVMNNDVVITVGGISVGDHDLVRAELKRWDVEERFWGVAIKPGKPVFFGTQGEKLVFGLPGNPVSALVTYLLFARPAILKRMGHPDPWPGPIRAIFRSQAKKKPGRTEFLRASLQDGEVRSLENQGSHQLGALAAANCLVEFPAGQTELKEGQNVTAIPIRWGI